jgi:hypothetical protein
VVPSRIPAAPRATDGRNPVAGQVAKGIAITGHAILSPTTEEKKTRVQDLTHP